MVTRWSRGQRRPVSTSHPEQQHRSVEPRQVLDMLTSQVLIARQRGLISEVDAVRIGAAVRDTSPNDVAIESLLQELSEYGGAAFCHPSGQRDLPRRHSVHNLARGQVRLGRVSDDPRNHARLLGRDFALDLAMLRTSMLVIGPPGSGKTRGLAAPVIEHLCLQSLARQASVVVLDTKEDFDVPGMFDVDITLGRSGGHTFDLYGGARTVDEASDRLVSALTDIDYTGNRSFYSDGSQNALRATLKVFHAAHGRYPAVRELQALLRQADGAVQSVRDKLKNQGLWESHKHLLDTRADQRGRREDTGASLVERVGLLCRDDIEAMLDPKGRPFSMAMINQPTRVRLAFPEARYPEASRLLTRVALAQFVTTASASTTNTGVFKGLVLDEAGRYIDDYVALGVQRLRARNAGMMLLTQALADIDESVRGTVFGSAGCKAVFGYVSPDDAEYFAAHWGKEWNDEQTHSVSDSTSNSTQESSPGRSHNDRGETTTSYNGPSRGVGRSRTDGVSTRQVERDIWPASDLSIRIPTGHAIVSAARTDGERVPPTLVNLRD